jgi:anthranilate synthase/aminodeoxychorismate synthase-like glutamine amidotransferase
MLADYIEQCEARCTVIRNNHPSLIDKLLKADAVVISPGPGRPEEANQLMEALTAIAPIKPILGVCLGHQAIGCLFGASLVHAKVPKHGKIETIKQMDPQGMYQQIPSSFSVTRYHSLVLSDCPSCLEVTAYSTLGEIMSVKHQHLPIWGVQYHPESCTTEYGIQLVKNFLQLAQQ